MSFLRKLQGMKLRKLIELHNQKFFGSRWSLTLKVVPGVRAVAIRRLFFLFCASNYHYPKDSVEYKAFINRAHKYLTDTIPGELPIEDQNLQRLQDAGYFSKDNIERLPINEIDGYLVTIGIWADVDEKDRRQMLYEYMFGPEIDGIHIFQGRAKPHRSRIQNKYCLTDIVLQFPAMTYNEFRRRFGNEMPTVTRGSFNKTRTKLRKAGYSMPRLRPGISDPAIRGKTKREYVN